MYYSTVTALRNEYAGLTRRKPRVIPAELASHRYCDQLLPGRSDEAKTSPATRGFRRGVQRALPAATARGRSGRSPPPRWHILPRGDAQGPTRRAPVIVASYPARMATSAQGGAERDPTSGTQSPVPFSIPPWVVGLHRDPSRPYPTGAPSFPRADGRDGAYESTLELKNLDGKPASFTKRRRCAVFRTPSSPVRARPGATGFLLSYPCAPGTPVDRDRSGYKTCILISRREVKDKRDVDAFSIERGIREDFFRPPEQWETRVTHRTKPSRSTCFPQIKAPAAPCHA